MRGAGLTVGAFYAHFRSKDELLAQAFAAAMDDMDGVMRSAAGGRSGAEALSAVTSTYLGEAHLNQVQGGCPLPAVAGEAVSSGDRGVRLLLASGLSTMRSRLVSLSGARLDTDTALGLCALLVGGQILARATRGTPLSTELLTACRAMAGRLVEVAR